MNIVGWIFYVTVVSAMGATFTVDHEFATEVECGIAWEDQRAKEQDFHVIGLHKVVEVSACVPVKHYPNVGRINGGTD
jgi:hypothetical protein